MAFSVGNRVRVTSQASVYRGQYGEVLATAADDPDNLNGVRLDGHRDSHLTKLSDAELQISTQENPVEQ